MRHTIVSKPLDWFKFDNIRQCFEEDALIALGKSLRRRQWHPVVARSDGTVIDGERRVRAARLENLESLDALIIDEAMSLSELRLAQAATAMHRADLTAGEKYDLCYELLQLRTDWREKDLAEHLCIHPSMVTRIMAASRTIPEVRQALKEGRLSTTDVYAISKVPDAEQPSLLEAKLHGASRDELEDKVKTARRKNGTVSAVRVDSVRCALPSGRFIVVTGPNLSLDDVVETFVEAVKEARKARDQSLDVKTWAAVMRDRAKSASGESTRRAG